MSFKKDILKEDIQNINLLAGKAYLVGMVIILIAFIFSIIFPYKISNESVSKYYYLIVLIGICVLYFLDKYIVIDFFVKLAIKKANCKDFDRKTGFCLYDCEYKGWFGFQWEVIEEKTNDEILYSLVIGQNKSKISKDSYNYLINYYQNNNKIFEDIKKENKNISFDDLQNFNVLFLSEDAWKNLKDNDNLESFEFKVFEE